GRRLAVAPGVTDLTEEGQCLGGIPGGVEVDEIRGRGFIGPGDLIVDSVERARYAREVRLGQRVVLHHVAGVRTLAGTEIDEVRRPHQIIAVVVAGGQFR